MNKLRRNTGRPFRFPFDIDRRIFLGLAAFFFIFSIKPINKLVFPRLTPNIISKKISKSFDQQRREFNKTIGQLDIRKTNLTNIDPKKLTSLSKKVWSLNIYKNDSLVLWNKSQKNIDPHELSVDSLHSYSTTSTIGIVLKKLIVSNKDSFTIIGEFPFYKEYKLKNSFFNSHFTFLNTDESDLEDFGFRLVPIIGKHPLKKSEVPVHINGIPRFKLAEKSSFLDLTDKNFWRFFLAAIPFIMFGVSIHTYYKVSVKRNPTLYFSLLLLTIIVIRGLTYCCGFPDNFSEFYLFNPSLYAADGLHTSLGDVFINACLIFWALFFFIMNIQGRILQIKLKRNQILFIASSVVALYLIGYKTVLNIRSIINDGGLSFDTTNYNNISPENIIGLGTVLLLFMNYVLMCIIFNRYFEKYFPSFQIKYVLPLLGIPLAYAFFDADIFEAMLYASVWTVVLLIFFSIRFLNTKFDFNSYKLIYWLIFLSISCVLIIHFFATQKEIKLRENLAKSLIHFENKNTEFKLKDLANDIENDKKIKADDFNSKKDIAEYVTREYLLEFEPEYSTVCNITKIDSSSPKAWFKEDNSNISNIITDSSGSQLYLFNELGNEQYILRAQLDSLLVNIRLEPTYTTSSDPQSTPLLEEFQQYRSDNKYEYEYAFYVNDMLVRQTGIQRFPEHLRASVSLKEGEISLGNVHGFSDVIAHTYAGDTRKSIIIRKQTNPIYRISTTYAYIFTTVFILITLYILGNIVARSNLRSKRFVNLLGLTLRMRIHLSILLVELISLTIIGVVTIYIFSNNARTNALQDANFASEEIKNAIRNLDINYSGIDSLKFEFNQDKFNYTVSPFLQKNNVGLNIFNLQGDLIFTTVSKKVSGVLPNLINPLARVDLLRKNNIPSLQTQRIGKLKYYTIYSHLRNKARKNVAILEIPNFSSQHAIKQNNSRIITMLINIYAFVFLLSSLFAFYITKRLTKSFSKIVTQFSKINLTSTNEPLHWPYSDEIGLLIKEYNRTLRKLENSTALLAKSERELAWREMAKQIAHDIKNPLTPMSLSLQTLQAAIHRNDPKVPELTERMTNTVLEQIKVLTRTATNFSEFAKMIDLEARPESLIDILESTTGIYFDNDQVEFLFLIPKKDIYVLVDKVKLIRVITNLIQNAIQSIPDERLGKIILSVTKENNNMVCVTVEDNGIGIPDEVKDKIFQPNFTTKTSGSGLGLAMCKDIMLKTGGDINFTTEEGKGSIFNISIPEYVGSLDDEYEEEDDDEDEDEIEDIEDNEDLSENDDS